MGVDVGGLGAVADGDGVDAAVGVVSKPKSLPPQPASSKARVPTVAAAHRVTGATIERAVCSLPLPERGSASIFSADADGELMFGRVLGHRRLVSAVSMAQFSPGIGGGEGRGRGDPALTPVASLGSYPLNGVSQILGVLLKGRPDLLNLVAQYFDLLASAFWVLEHPFDCHRRPRSWF
jgi:hypothetical protein